MDDRDGENRVVITGTLVDEPQLRYSPAGVPIARFLLEHGSKQDEAGVRRPLRFRIGIRAAGSPLAEAVAGIPPGTRLRIAGHLARARQKEGESRIIISASRIERLTNRGPDKE